MTRQDLIEEIVNSMLWGNESETGNRMGIISLAKFKQAILEFSDSELEAVRVKECKKGNVIPLISDYTNDKAGWDIIIDTILKGQNILVKEQDQKIKDWKGER